MYRSVKITVAKYSRVTRDCRVAILYCNSQRVRIPQLIEDVNFSIILFCNCERGPRICL